MLHSRTYSGAGRGRVVQAEEAGKMGCPITEVPRATFPAEGPGFLKFRNVPKANCLEPFSWNLNLGLPHWPVFFVASCLSQSVCLSASPRGPCSHLLQSGVAHTTSVNPTALEIFPCN